MIETTAHLHIFKYTSESQIEDGYYFEDETCYEHGPYESYDLAKVEFDRYCKEYL